MIWQLRIVTSRMLLQKVSIPTSKAFSQSHQRTQPSTNRSWISAFPPLFWSHHFIPFTTIPSSKVHRKLLVTRTCLECRYRSRRYYNVKTRSVYVIVRKNGPHVGIPVNYFVHRNTFALFRQMVALRGIPPLYRPLWRKDCHLESPFPKPLYSLCI